MLIGVTIGIMQMHLVVQNGLTIVGQKQQQQLAVKLLTMKQERLLKRQPQNLQEVQHKQEDLQQVAMKMMLLLVQVEIIQL